jgi:hypothetical protein
MIAASVKTRVVSWNDAAEMNESVDSDALVIPSSTFSYVAGILPAAVLHFVDDVTRQRFDTQQTQDVLRIVTVV